MLYRTVFYLDRFPAISVLFEEWLVVTWLNFILNTLFNSNWYSRWPLGKITISLLSFCSWSTQTTLISIWSCIITQRICTLSSRFQFTIAFQTACACSLHEELSNLGISISCSSFTYEITIVRRSSFDFRASKAGNSFPNK